MDYERNSFAKNKKTINKYQKTPNVENFNKQTVLNI